MWKEKQTLLKIDVHFYLKIYPIRYMVVNCKSPSNFEILYYTNINILNMFYLIFSFISFYIDEWMFKMQHTIEYIIQNIIK